MTDADIRRIAERVAKELFTDRNGVEVRRYVMEVYPDQYGGMAGLSKEVVRDRIEDILKQELQP